jgi:LemA protein
MSATSPTEKADANNQLTTTLKSLFALSESYPDLKANAGFLDLQSKLTELEDKIASARRYFNATIKEYNTTLESFPSNIIAGLFGFKNQQDYFAVSSEEEKVAPKVQF